MELQINTMKNCHNKATWNDDVYKETKDAIPRAGKHLSGFISSLEKEPRN